MSLLVTIPDAQWLTLVPAAGLARRTVGVPEGLWYGTTLLYGDGSGGTLTLFWDTSFAIKDRWVMEWEAVSCWVLDEAVQSGVLQVNTGPNVPDPMVTGIQNPSFTQVKLGVAAVGAATQTFDYDLGSGGGSPAFDMGNQRDCRCDAKLLSHLDLESECQKLPGERLGILLFPTGSVPGVATGTGMTRAPRHGSSSSSRRGTLKLY